MAGTSDFYEGAQYGLDKPNSGEFLGMGYRTPVSSIGWAVDARTANQIKAVTDKLNTGAQNIEIQMLTPDVEESIPNQHLEELNKLRKITGVDFTLHGPLIEPTGITRQGWDEKQRVQAERQMWSALERAHKVKPDGNLVVTFHSSNGLPEPESYIKEEGKKEPEMQVMWAVDKNTGKFQSFESKDHHFPGEIGDPKKEMQKANEENWNKMLQHVNFNAYQGAKHVEQTLASPYKDPKTGKQLDINAQQLLEQYKIFGTPESQQHIKDLGEYGDAMKEKIYELTHGHLYLRDIYGELKTLYDTAYGAAKSNGNKEDMKKLDAFAEEIKPKLADINDPTKVRELAEEIVNGVNVLRTIKAPEVFTPLRDFAVDKASDTFAGLAIKSYNEFERKKKEKAPIISIENPPAGSGFSRAEDLRQLIEASRGKFVDHATNKWGMSKSEAAKQAEKMIGATWDVGHINMIRKSGFTEEDLKKETQTIGKYVKNIHLSDNFGMEHTELPMGMGNVPTKMHMDILDQYGKQIKKIVEVGNWHQHFQVTPFNETMEAMGSSIYGGGAPAPYWNQAAGRLTGGYFSGYGNNPDVHHSIYGAGFAGLPTELGGQIQSGRGRFAGTPME